MERPRLTIHAPSSTEERFSACGWRLSERIHWSAEAELVTCQKCQHRMKSNAWRERFSKPKP